ncbi:MAG: hypothetical protein HFJ91_00705 [Muribaculaceae bacterium]|nr:hypothetical protein [Muribaculaceae bacterium]
MTTPIINPSTLSEEQRKAIRIAYQSLQNEKPSIQENVPIHFGVLGAITELELLFGSELFKKGE